MKAWRESTPHIRPQL